MAYLTRKTDTSWPCLEVTEKKGTAYLDSPPKYSCLYISVVSREDLLPLLQIRRSNRDTLEISFSCFYLEDICSGHFMELPHQGSYILFFITLLLWT